MGYYPVFQAIRLGRVRSGTGSWFKWKRKANNNRRKVRSKEWVRFWFEPRKHFCPSAWRCWAPLWTTTTYHVDPTRDGCSAGLKGDWIVSITSNLLSCSSVPKAATSVDSVVENRSVAHTLPQLHRSGIDSTIQLKARSDRANISLLFKRHSISLRFKRLEDDLMTAKGRRQRRGWPGRLMPRTTLESIHLSSSILAPMLSNKRKKESEESAKKSDKKRVSQMILMISNRRHIFALCVEFVDKSLNNNVPRQLWPSQIPK